MEANIEVLVRRYQDLFGDFQAGKIDEGFFIAEVDKLQFRDDWGRYWMLGAQTGAWHYYDGQAWHQADPNDADKLPFIDEQGRYWQKGAKSGNWYYYQPDTGEWVKPGAGDPIAPSFLHQDSGQAAPPFAEQPAQPYAQAPGPVPQADPAVQFEAQLFQDDEGRYWTTGTKTGQWYFFDEQGWHPADEFQQTAAAPQQQPVPYQTQGAYNASQPAPTQPVLPQNMGSYQAGQASGQQPVGQQQSASRQSIPLAQSQADMPVPEPQVQAVPLQSTGQYTSPQVTQTTPHSQPVAYQQPQPSQGYGQPGQTVPGEMGAAYSVPSPANADPQHPAMATSPHADSAGNSTPVPPQGASQSGTWFYFDGQQWLKYSSGEPAEEPPPDPRLVLEQNPANAAKGGAAAEPVVAELFEDDEPPIEIVDVEVITVIEAEPDIEPEPEPYIAPAPAPEPAPAPAQAPLSASPADDVRPRRTRTATDKPAADVPPEPQHVARRRTPSDPVRPVTPRKKLATNEPTIIIPTGSTASGAASPSSSRTGRVKKSQPPAVQQRAREDTRPMEPVPLPSAGGLTPTPRPVRHRQVTQPLPQVTQTPASRTESGQLRTTQRAHQVTEDLAVTTPAESSAQQEQSRKEGYTLGDIFRAFPSTFWTGVAGVAVLLIVASLIIFGATMFSMDDSPLSSGIAAVQSPTPTLAASLPDSSPTPGPTPTGSVDTEATSTPASLIDFRSLDLGFTLEYPEAWFRYEDDLQVILSPSEEGLDPQKRKDTTIRIGRPADNSFAISDLLTGVLARFPAEAETLNEGTISIASQTWTSTQIRFEDDDLGGEGIATLAVTSKDGIGYFLIAIAPAEEWNSVQPLFQGVINSFQFTQIIAKTTTEPTSTVTGVGSATSESDDSATVSATPTVAATQSPTPLPASANTPVTYIIKSGDTLLAIAVEYGVDVDLLASENGITDPGSLRVDQPLTIPYTSEELAEYYASGGVVTTASPADNDDSGTEASPSTSAEAPPSEVASAETDSIETASSEAAEVPEEEPPAPEAPPLSGRIVYPAFNNGRNIYDLWLVNLATGEQSTIVGEASQPAFNQDGSLLAYRSWGRSTRGIFFKDFVGGRGGKVTNFAEDGLPSWSPDGFSFAFASRKEGDRVPRIYIGNQQGDDAFGLSFQGEYPATFPDGRLIVKGCTPSGDCGLFVMGGSGGGAKKVSGDGGDTAATPSPDGNKIAFMSIGRGGSNWEIWVMNADGSNPQRLTENGNNDGLPTWSPDGQTIAYVSDAGGVWAIWAMNIDGSSQRKIVDMVGSPDGNVLHDEFNSRGWLEERISWAP